MTAVRNDLNLKKMTAVGDDLNLKKMTAVGNDLKKRKMMAVQNDLKKIDSCPFCHQKSAPTTILPSKAVPMSVFPSKLSIFSQLCQFDWPHCQISCSIDLSIHSSLPLLPLSIPLLYIFTLKRPGSQG